MSVGRRLFWSLSALVACAALVGGVAIAGLVSLGRHHRSTEEQYEQLRAIYEVGQHAATARYLLDGDAPASLIRAQLLAATPAARRIDADGFGLAVALEDAGRRLDDADRAAARTGVNRALGQVVGLASSAESRIIANRAAATTRLRAIIGVMAGLLAVTGLAATVVGVRLYRSIMRPLAALNDAIGDLGDARLGARIAEQGDGEFRRLIAHFNRTSTGLAELHASMQERVEVKSRQLVRSERLAGIGSLAAGLAHEINNPLGIIAGYAETSLRRLRAMPQGPQRDELLAGIEQTIQTICEEAFRCRDITRDLLTLAQPAEGELTTVQMPALVERAASLVGRLPIARDREIVVTTDGPASVLTCRGHAGQLLQVLINLLTNALEACPPDRGRVAVRLSRSMEGVAVSVTDDGCGMTPEQLARAFDPFFTDKPRRGQPGCGLGLSISHAIVERHDGRLYATSDGPGCGSTFCVELPGVPATTSEPRWLAGTR